MQGIKAAAAHFEFPPPIRLMAVGTSHLSVGLMRGQLKFLREAGFDVCVVSSPGPRLYVAAEDEGVQAYAVPMVREISGLSDLVSLWRLWRLMQRVRPAITNVGTPKAGLLGGLASVLGRVPCRVYTLRGLRCESANGWKRWCMILAERLACRCAHRVICVSDSLRAKAMALAIADPRKFVVLGSGSSNGVEIGRFAPTPDRLRQAAILRTDLMIPANAPVIGFVGRFTRDKGICELINAFLQLRHQHPELRLLLVGDFEEGDPVPSGIRNAIQDDTQIIRTGTVQDPAAYYHVMDVLALPTYREGFPNTVLEAHAAGKPVVTTRATGALDAVQDRITGILVPAGDVDSLTCALSQLIRYPEMAQQMGSAGHERVQHEFRQDSIWKALEKEFLSLLQEKGLPVPQAEDNQCRAATQFSREFCLTMSRFVKESLDFLVATVALLLLGPLLACIAFAVRLSIGSPVLFRHVRPGYNGKPFVLLKFRTMNSTRDSRGHLLPDQQRLTKLGQLLRRFSLDEIPQLWNVWKGEMSLVGPRPLLMEYLECYTPEQARRHDVKPGITGWAQVNGRNALSWEERFRLDVWYVDHWSLGLDARIILKTIRKVLLREGISQNGHATMPRFLGNNQAR